MGLYEIVRNAALGLGILTALQPLSYQNPFLRTVYAQEENRKQNNNVEQQKNKEDVKLQIKDYILPEPVFDVKRITLEEAKKGNKQVQSKYIDQLLKKEFPFVYDKKLNPKGFVEMYDWDTVQGKKEAIKRMADHEKITGESVKNHSGSLDLWGLLVFDLGNPGCKKKYGFCIVKKSRWLNRYEKESDLLNEVRWIQIDFAVQEFGLQLGKEELKGGNPVLDLRTIAVFYGSRCLLENVLSKKFGEVSEKFKEWATKMHLCHYGSLYRDLRFCEERLGDKLQEFQKKEPFDDEKLGDFLYSAHKRLSPIIREANDILKSFGYSHKLVDEKSNKWELVKIEPSKDSSQK